MFRSATLAALLALGFATPATATPRSAEPRQIPCAVGPYAKISQLTAERVTARLNEADEQDIRYEYRVILRNPHRAPAEVVTGLDLPGVVEAAPLAVTVPPRGSAEVLLGWVPVSNPLRHRAPPSPAEVQRHLTLEACHVDTPGMAARVI